MDENENDELPVMAFQHVMMMLLAVVAAVMVLPTWLPALTGSIDGEEPTAFWYLSRASAMIAYLLAWLSMVLGVSMTNKLARLWPGGPVAFDLHQHTSLLSIAFALFHALILLGDKYIAYTLLQILTPFASTNYEPLWVGAGQIAFYLMVIVGFSFYVRKQITQKVWRWIHYLSFVMFLLVMGHGIMAGTDSDALWAKAIYWVTGGSLMFLIMYRVVMMSPAFQDKPARKNAGHGAQKTTT
jgi:predicted ferric reductase